MTPATIIREATKAGIALSLTDSGTIKVRGEAAAVNQFAPLIREHKAELIEWLATPTQDSDELREAAGPDWLEAKHDPAMLDALARAIEVRKMRERGEVPPHYTESTVCRGCGLVPIFPGVPEHVDGCPWCWNRVAGNPMPRAPQRSPAKMGHNVDTGGTCATGQKSVTERA